MAELVAAVDQGTTSTRCLVFDGAGREVGRAQAEHRQLLPRAGWVEHDPVEIWERTGEVVAAALAAARVGPADLAGLGIANQRETTVVWDRRTGRPYGPAIVWQDTRTAAAAAALARDGRGEVIRDRTGIPPATYFSGLKIAWVLDTVPGARAAAEDGTAMFGTVDSWLLWNLTGGTDGGVHATDVTNASRTMLMDLTTLDYDPELLSLLDVPRAMLPEIRASAPVGGFGRTRPDGPLGGEVGVAAVLGDQQAAMLGQVCLDVGEAKNTYGTGNFLLLNTGTTPVRSAHGLLTTVCCRLGSEPATYALEGSIAVTGSAVQWLRDQLGVIATAAEVEGLAASVDDTGGVVFVPAFSGLFAPHWRPDARGAVLGLSRFSTRAHLARAALEAICYQTVEVARAMEADAGTALAELRVDGGVTANDLCMQIQADTLGVDVVRPEVAETTALGAAYAAGLATGLWSGPEELRGLWAEDRRWSPRSDAAGREAGLAGWQRAVERTLDWVEV